MKVCVLGMGYMGLPTACLLASAGHTVIGVDINRERIEQINNGVLPFEENGLEELFDKARRNGFTAKTEVEEADVFLIAVPTPLEKKAKRAELSCVRSAAEMIAKKLRRGNLVILESTVPPTTCTNFLIPILENSGLKAGSDFSVAYCPERAFPGRTLHEIVNNERIIGGIDERSAAAARQLYSSFVKANIYTTDTTTAEFVKLAENTFRDVNIALANEFAVVCEQLGINANEVIELANKHPRVNIHKPGPGVGGHCIAVDPWFITEVSRDAKMVRLARKRNDSMPKHVIGLIEKILQSSMISNAEKPTIAVLGVSYKADVDDVRESPAYEVIKLARRKGWNVKVHDPIAKGFKHRITSLENALKDSDCAVLITNHRHFLDIDFSRFKMRNMNIVDTRNFLNHSRLREQGFKVVVLGDGKSIRT